MCTSKKTKEISSNYAFLVHHGVEGQKWGVRHGPPYPLNRGSRKTSNKSTSSKSKKTKISAESIVSKYEKTRVSAVGMSDESLQAATYAVAVVAMMGISKLIRAKAETKDRSNELEWLEEANKNKSIKSFKDTPRLHRKTSAAESMKVTNPDYPSPGTTMNCTFCTTAMALREKGYDVRATKRERGTYSDTLFAKTFNSPTVKMKHQTSDSMLKELSNNGEGAYGNLTVRWRLGGGHSIFWKVENGKTRIYDGQSGKEYTSSDADYKLFFQSINSKNIEYNRLDNHEPTEYALALVEKNR